jgi:Kelch motif
MKSVFAFTLLVFGVADRGPVAMAQSAGTFAATGDMTTVRAGHSATLLPDGRVLIAGGSVGRVRFVPTNSAELYDPSRGTFAATGSMTTARLFHIAILLPDGRVLVTGGATGDSALSAELYDPSTGAFTATGGMSGPHGFATLLNNGKVLMGGPSIELYDPATGTFTATGDFAGTTARTLGNTATLIADGRVLFSASDGPAELYDPATGKFGLTAAMTYGYADFGRSATLLMSGKVLFAGGEDSDNGPYPYAELYDPSTGTFTATGNMTMGRIAQATLLPDGRVLITGGGEDPTPPYATTQRAELYDPSTGSFRSFGNMISGRLNQTATLLKDGRVLIAGGAYWPVIPGPASVLSSAELYTPPILTPAPVLFSLSGDGRGQGAIWHATTGEIASSNSPAVAGEVLSMYTTSLADDGVIPPQVSIGGRLAQVLYFGASGYSGYNQVNFRVPSGVAAGPAVPVRLNYIGRSSNEVTLGAQ